MRNPPAEAPFYAPIPPCTSYYNSTMHQETHAPTQHFILPDNRREWSHFVLDPPACCPCSSPKLSLLQEQCWTRHGV